MIRDFRKKIKTLMKYFMKISPSRILVFGFAALILLGACLLNLPAASRTGQPIGFLDALFTATSATCVTGLIVVDTYTHWTWFGQVVILALIQVGGLGFMTLVTMFSLFLRRTITMRERLLMAESLNYEQMQGIVRLVRHILIGTFTIEGIGAVLLSLRFIPDFGFWGGIAKGIFHSISAFCNAGFDILGEQNPFSSLTDYSGDWIVNLTIMALIVIGGLGFVVWEDFWENRRWSRFRLHTKMVLLITAFLIFGGAFLIFLFEISNPDTLLHASWSEKILGPLFQSVTSRTAGYNTLPLAQMQPASLFVMILLMFIGGSPGSTAGGVKTTTLGVILAAVFSVVRGSEDVHVFGRKIVRAAIFKSLVVMMLGVVILSTGVMILLVVEDFSFLEILYEVTSAFGTVGVTMGITPMLSGISKFVLILIMFTGRVGIFSVLFAVAVRRHQNGSALKYPEGKIIVG